MAWEPWMEAERREAAWDRLVADTPRCDVCDKLIFEPDRAQTLNGMTMCPYCFHVRTENVRKHQRRKKGMKA